MDSSEHDASTEPPISDAEPETGQEQAQAPPDASSAPEDVIVHAPDVEPAEPGIYVYDSEEGFGNHPFLGELKHGENDFTAETHPDKLQAIGDLVAAGVLRKA